MNGEHRSKWLSEIISDLQRYIKQANKRQYPELAVVQQGLEKLYEGRDIAKASGETESEPA
jgi:hypothetical protein